MEPFSVRRKPTPTAWYLKQGRAQEFRHARIIRGRSRFWSEMMQHQTHDAYWSGRNFTRELRNVRVAGAKHRRLGGTRKDFLRPACRSAKVWDRTARWWSARGRTAAGTPPMPKTSVASRRSISAADKAAPIGAREIQRLVFWPIICWASRHRTCRAPRCRSATGVNQWMRYDAWAAQARRMAYSRWRSAVTARSRSARRPATKPCRASYVSDPANPIPYLSRPFRTILWAGADLDKDVPVTLARAGKRRISASRGQPPRHAALRQPTADRAIRADR